MRTFDGLSGRALSVALRSTQALLATTPLMAVVVPAIAQAQPADQGNLGEIIVTAQKRETNIQKTPLAITALSGQALDRQQVLEAQDLNGLVPSLVISPSEGYQRSVAIRGIGLNVPQNDGAQPSVSYHNDGVYIVSPIALNTEYLDVNRIEVVRGPQGTVYGQNSTGGTINVINNQPSLKAINGNIELDLGNFDLVHVRGALNVPLSSTVAVRAAFDFDKHSGYAIATQVPGTNGHYGLGNDNTLHGRVALLWEPSSELSVELRAEYARTHRNESESKNILDPDPDPWRESSDWPGKFNYRNGIYSGVINYDLNFANLKAIGSYQTVDHDGSLSEDGLSLALTSPYHDVEYLFHRVRSETGEVDLTSKNGGRLDWVIGLFYLNTTEHVGYDQYMYSLEDPSHPNQLYDNPTSLDPNTQFYNLARFTRESYSAYGQATFHVTNTLRLTGGLRETHDHNQTISCSYLCGPSPVSAGGSVNALTGRLGIEYDLWPGVLAYATASTGFKPGGGNLVVSPVVVGYEYGPEHIRAYEAGFKSRFAENRATVNLAGFYYDYKDLQFEEEDLLPFNGGVGNIPKAYVYGVEGEGSLLLPANFRLDGSVTVETSKITSHELILDNVRATIIDREYGYFTDEDLALRGSAATDAYGQHVPNLPKTTASASLTHTLKFGNGSVLTSSLTAIYRSSYIDTVFGDEVINGQHVYRAPSYTLLNLNIGYEIPQSGWKLALTIKNLTDTAAVLGQFTNQFDGETTRQYYQPRQFIVTLGYKF